MVDITRFHTLVILSYSWVKLYCVLITPSITVMVDITRFHTLVILSYSWVKLYCVLITPSITVMVDITRFHTLVILSYSWVKLYCVLITPSITVMVDITRFHTLVILSYSWVKLYCVLITPSITVIHSCLLVIVWELEGASVSTSTNESRKANQSFVQSNSQWIIINLTKVENSQHFGCLIQICLLRHHLIFILFYLHTYIYA